MIFIPAVYTQPRFCLTSSGQAMRTVLQASPKFSRNHLMSVFLLTSLTIHIGLSRAIKEANSNIIFLGIHILWTSYSQFTCLFLLQKTIQLATYHYTYQWQHDRSNRNPASSCSRPIWPFPGGSSPYTFHLPVTDRYQDPETLPSASLWVLIIVWLCSFASLFWMLYKWLHEFQL